MEKLYNMDCLFRKVCKRTSVAWTSFLVPKVRLSAKEGLWNIFTSFSFRILLFYFFNLNFLNHYISLTSQVRHSDINFHTIRERCDPIQPKKYLKFQKSWSITWDKKNLHVLKTKKSTSKILLTISCKYLGMGQVPSVSRTQCSVWVSRVYFLIYPMKKYYKTYIVRDRFRSANARLYHCTERK